MNQAASPISTNLATTKVIVPNINPGFIDLLQTPMASCCRRLAVRRRSVWLNAPLRVVGRVCGVRGRGVVLVG